MFVDEAIVLVSSGKGGNGCVSFRREKFAPRGGPDGGDGGRGGSVYLCANRDLTTLSALSSKPFYRAESGRDGGGNNCSGRGAEDLVIEVPVGTLTREILPDRPPREGRLRGELLSHSKRLLVARGGKGGRGNKAFASATNQVPRDAEDGVPGEQIRLYLELKLLADVGLIGLPNSGKSTLLSRISAATPKIADYPFTTLRPNLGIADLGNYKRIVVADIPGLIEGAHEGAGLGMEFLRHIERTSVLVQLVSIESATVERMVADYRTVESELAQYSAKLAGKPRIAVASKIDLLPAETQKELIEAFREALGCEILPLSAVSGQGLKDVLAGAVRLLRAGEQDDTSP
jgi:GTP-binding protein